MTITWYKASHVALRSLTPVNKNVSPTGGRGRKSVTEDDWQAGGIRLFTTCQTRMREFSANVSALQHLVTGLTPCCVDLYDGTVL